MKRIQWKMVLATMIFTMCLTAPAWAGRFGGGHGCGHGFHGKGDGHLGFGFLRALNLTETQQDQVRAVLAKYKETIKSQIDTLAGAHQEMAHVMHAETLDEAALRNAFKNVAGAREEMVVLRAKIIQEIRPILTTDQIDRLNEMRNRRAERFEQRSEKRWDRFEDWLDEPSV